jgi:hypothetical protein
MNIIPEAGIIAIVPIIIAICQAIKMTGLDSKWMPFISMGVGIGISFIANHDMADLTSTLLNGLMYGLSASGLYSGISTTAKAIAHEKARKADKHK